MAINIGDKIITNEKCPIGKEHTGMVITINDNGVVGVIFDDPKKWKNVSKGIIPHYLNGAIQEPLGFFIEKDQYKLDQKFLYKNEDRVKEKFINQIKSIIIKKKLQIPTKIRQLDAIKKSRKRDISSYEQNIKIAKNDITQYEKEIKEWEEKGKEEITFEPFELQYDKIKKHSKIDSILFEGSYIIVKTKDLTYKRGSFSFPLGAYYIYFNTVTQEIKAINYKKHYNREYFHPCIERGSICMGSILSREIQKYKKELNIVMIIFSLIQFLEEPNYGAPYIQDRSFKCAQDVTFKPKKLLDYLNMSLWREKEKWDSDLYNEQYE